MFFSAVRVHDEKPRVLLARSREDERILTLDKFFKECYNVDDSGAARRMLML